MFIQDLQIDRFGSIANLELDNLTDGVTVVFGGPGTGKSTLLQFASAILYGFDESTRARYLPSISSAEFGGSITWAQGHHRYTVRRHDDGKFNGHVEFLDDGQVGGRMAWTDALRGISAELYSRLFAVDYSHRPDVSRLLDEAAKCGLSVEDKPIDTVKQQELKQRLTTLQATLASLGTAEQPTEALHRRRRELLDDIARIDLDVTRCHTEQSQTQSQIEAIQAQLVSSRQELQAVRKSIDELAAARQECRSRLARAESAAANNRTHETEIRELDTKIARWKQVLDDAAQRYETLGKQVVPSSECDCQRQQLTRTQAELQISLRYLEEEREMLVADSRHAPTSTDEIDRLRKQLEGLDQQEAELRQRFDAVTLSIRQQEMDLAALQQRLQGRVTDLEQRLARHREELQHIEGLLNEFERRQTLLESIAETEHQIRTLENSRDDSVILRAATNYLRRISGDEFQRIEVSHGKHVWVADAKGHRLSWGHLSEGIRDKVYLSLSLALVEAHDRSHPPLPLMWKDLFTNFDSRQVPETAELLCNFARDGRQLLILTRHEHVTSVLRVTNVPERHLTATPDWQATANQLQYQRSAQDVNQLLTVASEADGAEVDPAWELDAQPGANEEFFLYEESPIERSPSLSSDNVVRLRRLGITMVSDLLEADADDASENLSYAGITRKMVANWQSQALLMCHVARLREYDARILVACGISNPSQLRQIPPTEVRLMIERFAESSEGRAMLLSGTEFELSRVTDWVQTDESEREERRPSKHDPSITRQRGPAPSNPNGAARRDRSSERSPARSARRSANGSSGRSSVRASQRTDNGSDRREVSQADVVKMKSSSTGSGLRFFLDSDAGVVDAPSIGPRSAERLEEVGVVTVSDFLAADVDDVAGRLKNKRMSAKMLREWQQQTELVCRVPQLRGHDAQILVAVGVTEVQELAALDPQELWAKVEPFVSSTPGKRIIRSSKAPDFEEVFNWIEWANQARALKVA